MAEPDLLLDSDVLIEILRGMPEAGVWLNTHTNQVLGIPMIVRMEILHGAQNKQEQRLLIQELQRFPVVHLEYSDSVRALSWFESFYLSHRLGIMDCLIAAVAVRLDQTLYTFNLKHYQPITQLDVRAPYHR